MTVIIHEVDDHTGELLLRATPPAKAISLDWIRGVHRELGRLLEQLELLGPVRVHDNARVAFVIASRMLVSDLYVAIRHAELESEPNQASHDLEPHTPCVRKGCGHTFEAHHAPGAECTAIVGSDGAGPLHCACPRFQSPMPVSIMRKLIDERTQRCTACKAPGPQRGAECRALELGHPYTSGQPCACPCHLPISGT